MSDRYRLINIDLLARDMETVGMDTRAQALRDGDYDPPGYVQAAEKIRLVFEEEKPDAETNTLEWFDRLCGAVRGLLDVHRRATKGGGI